MVAELPLVVKDAPVLVPPTVKEQPPEVEAVTTVRAAKLTVATPPHPQGAAVALLGVPPCVLAVVLLPVKGVSTPVRGLARQHVPAVAKHSARVRTNITCKKA